MSCADFEQALTRLLAGEEDAEGRAARLEALGAHARTCPDCADASDLLEFLSLPSDERDLAQPPPDRYWGLFEAGLKERLARCEPRPHRGWAPWAGIAAALLLAAAGLWLVFPSGDTGAPGGKSTAREHGRDEIPETLEALLRGAEPEEALAGLDFLGGLTGVPEAAPEAADAEAAGDGPAGNDGLLYPDTQALDAEARRELLEWLRERSGRDRGVES